MLGCRGSFGKCLEVKRQGRLSGVGWEGKEGGGRVGREVGQWKEGQGRWVEKLQSLGFGSRKPECPW